MNKLILFYVFAWLLCIGFSFYFIFCIYRIFKGIHQSKSYTEPIIKYKSPPLDTWFGTITLIVINGILIHQNFLVDFPPTFPPIIITFNLCGLSLVLKGFLPNYITDEGILFSTGKFIKWSNIHSYSFWYEKKVLEIKLSPKQVLSDSFRYHKRDVTLIEDYLKGKAHMVNTTKLDYIK